MSHGLLVSSLPQWKEHVTSPKMELHSYLNCFLKVSDEKSEILNFGSSSQSELYKFCTFRWNVRLLGSFPQETNLRSRRLKQNTPFAFHWITLVSREKKWRVHSYGITYCFFSTAFKSFATARHGPSCFHLNKIMLLNVHNYCTLQCLYSI